MSDEAGRSISVVALHTSVSVSSNDKKDTLEKIKKVAESLLDRYKSQGE